MDLTKEFQRTREIKQYNSNIITHVYTKNELNGFKDIGKNIDNINIMHTDTVEAILNSNVKTAALNFADAYTLGGLVLFGVKTQEKDLCRSSNLYESLTLPIIKNYNNKIILKI